MILLAYDSNTGGYIVILTCVFKIYIRWIYPLNHSLSSSLSPLLRIISQGLILLFSCMHTKHIYCMHPHSPFPCVHRHSTGIEPQKRFIFLSWPLFFNYMHIDSPAGFCLATAGLYISCLLESFFQLCHIHTIAFHCLSLHNEFDPYFSWGLSYSLYSYYWFLVPNTCKPVVPLNLWLVMPRAFCSLRSELSNTWPCRFWVR
jgi:hypothetical protein